MTTSPTEDNPHDVRLVTEAGDAPASPTGRRPLIEAFPLLTVERTPATSGSVPLPDWPCVRAVLGGADRAELEAAYSGSVTEQRIAERSLAEAAHLGATLPPGLHTFTGQTGGGKSALVMNLALAAIEHGHPVLYVSLELDARELAARLVGLAANLPWAALALGRPLTPEQREARDAVLTARGTLAATPFYTTIPDGPLALHALRDEVRSIWQAHERRAPLVIFDYLQLASVRGPDSGYEPPLRERISAVTLELRRLSREESGAAWPGCPVVVLSSTARATVKGEGAVPGMDGKYPDLLRKADLETLKALPKEAGEIEATAVTAWVLALGEKADGGARPLALRLAKSRLGPPGAWVPFVFRGLTGKLEEAPTRYATPCDPPDNGERPRSKRQTESL